jgi:hypothetical protein
MAIEASPVAIQANSYSAELFRRGTSGFQMQRGSTVGSVLGGLVGSGDFVTTYGGSGLGVTTSSGEAIVAGSSSTTQGGYYVRGSSATANTPSAASGSNPRIDLIYLQVNDAAYSGATNNGTCSIATGTPTGGASLSNLSGAPSLPTSSLALAYVLIPASASTISNSDILNLYTYVYFSPNIFNVRAASGAVNANSGDHVKVTGGSSAVTLPLPYPNARVKVTNIGSGVPTVAQHASEVIYGWGMTSSGVASFPLGAYGATATVESDGTNWFVTAGMQDSGWLTPGSFGNSWTNGSNVAYRLQGNTVRLRGDLGVGTNNTTAYTLGSAYRPQTNILVPIFADTSGPTLVASYCEVTTGGAVSFFYTTSPSSLAQDGVNFTVD